MFPIAETAALTVVAMVFASSACADNQIPGPDGWSAWAPNGPGVVAGYRLPEKDGTYRHVVNAVVYSNYPSLEAFITKNHNLLHSNAGVRVLDEKRITICGKEPAWEVEYSHPGSVTATANTVIVSEQVVAVQGRYTYIASYIRPSTYAKRFDADRWVHAYCKRGT